MRQSILTTLEEEHQVIEKALDALQRAILSTPDWNLYEDILDFLARFADRFHHEKEEQYLFPRMAERGVPEEGGPLGCMLDEHTEARQLIANMRQACGSHSQERFTDCARDYLQLLRQHIMKENNILFPMARRALNASDEAELSARAEEVAAAMPEAAALRQKAQRFVERAFSAKSH